MSSFSAGQDAGPCSSQWTRDKLYHEACLLHGGLIPCIHVIKTDLTKPIQLHLLQAFKRSGMAAGSILPYAALWHLGFAAWAFSVFKTFASVGSGLQPFRRFVVSQGADNPSLPFGVKQLV